MNQHQFDVIVVGAGMVGTALALALGRHDFKVALVGNKGHLEIFRYWEIFLLWQCVIDLWWVTETNQNGD